MSRINQFSWNEIKHQVKIANPSIYQVIEEINPSEYMPFFLAQYDFGEHFGIKNHAYLPTSNGKLERIDSQYTDNELFQHLGYGKDSLPLGMILDKFCEWHYFDDDGRIYPCFVQGPGAIFNMQVIFNEIKTVDNNLLSASSGALSSFLLPNIGCKRKHGKLQKSFNVNSPAPKSPYEQYIVFNELLKNKTIHHDWHSQILYFPEQFVEEVKNNDKWLKLKLYFSEALRKKMTHNTNSISTNELFLSIDSINRYRPTPFILDTAKYIFNICMGSGIGIKPAIDENHFPVRAIQNIYSEFYDLEYTPTVMVPTTMNSERDSVYYPLQCPLAKINTYKTQSNSAYNELEMLKNVLLSYQSEFIEESNAAYGSPLYNLCKEIEFSFFHYMSPGTQNISNPSNLIGDDKRFSFSYSNKETKFASDAKLFRGCVRLTR